MVTMLCLMMTILVLHSSMHIVKQSLIINLQVKGRNTLITLV